MTNRTNRHRVLVADDVKMVALKIAGALKANGYETAIASDGEQCLELVQSFDPHLLILDIMMPKIHGLEVLKQLQGRDLGTIVCTSKDYKSDMSLVQELGAVDVVIKPFEQRELIEKVEDFFASGTSRASHEATDAAKPADAGDVFEHELRKTDGCVRFWGTRGSTSVAEPKYLRHGGNTSCMSVTYGDDQIIFDAGSGIRLLGMAMMSGGPRRIHLFMTHTHWDHIQGFPFFTPVYVPGFEITVYGIKGVSKDLESLFQGQLGKEYFPVDMEDMAATIRVCREGRLGALVGAQRLPAGQGRGRQAVDRDPPRSHARRRVSAREAQPHAAASARPGPPDRGRPRLRRAG
jgi:CheY-like chemotaxis protein